MGELSGRDTQGKDVRRLVGDRGRFRKEWVRQKQMILGGLRKGGSWCLI